MAVSGKFLFVMHKILYENCRIGLTEKLIYATLVNIINRRDRGAPVNK